MSITPCFCCIFRLPSCLILYLSFCLLSVVFWVETVTGLANAVSDPSPHSWCSNNSPWHNHSLSCCLQNHCKLVYTQHTTCLSIIHTCKQVLDSAITGVHSLCSRLGLQVTPGGLAFRRQARYGCPPRRHHLEYGTHLFRKPVWEFFWRALKVNFSDEATDKSLPRLTTRRSLLTFSSKWPDRGQAYVMHWQKSLPAMSGDLWSQKGG